MSAFLGQEIESKKAFLPYYVTNLIYNMLKLYSVKAFKYIFVAVGCYVTFTRGISTIVLTSFTLSSTYEQLVIPGYLDNDVSTST